MCKQQCKSIMCYIFQLFCFNYNTENRHNILPQPYAFEKKEKTEVITFFFMFFILVWIEYFPNYSELRCDDNNIVTPPPPSLLSKNILDCAAFICNEHPLGIFLYQYLCVLNIQC